jgi:hypothetical protein
VARVDASSGVTAGERSRLWLDIAKIHLFDTSDGSSLTRRDDTVSGTGTHGNGDGAPPPHAGGPPPPGDRAEGGATSMGEGPPPEG